MDDSVVQFGQNTASARQEARETLRKQTHHSLVRNIRRRVIIRMGILAGILAGLFGIAAYEYLVKNLNDSMLEHGRNQLGSLVPEIRQYVEFGESSASSDLEQKLQTGLNQEDGTTKGRFIYAAVFNLGQKTLVRAGVREIQPLEAFESKLNLSSERFPVMGKINSRRIFGTGAFRIQLMGMLKNADGKGIGYLEAVYELRPETVAAGRREILWTSMAAAGIVFITSLVLYPVIMGLVGRLTGAIVRLTQSHFEALTVLSGAIAKRDRETSEHNFRVTIMSVRLAETVGFEPSDIQRLFKGALIHDVGKIGEHDAILLKEGKLTETEYAEMKKHVIYGCEIIQSSPWLVDGADVVKYHHEKYDGSGYPEGLAGEKIPKAARLFAIIDVFDALTARRPYKEPLSLNETLGILKQGRGSHFDPELLDQFLGMASALYDEMTHSTLPQIEKELVRIVIQYFVKVDENFD